MASRPTVALIGGGVVGLALARSLAMSGVAVTILEAAPHLLSRASGGNSGIACTGYDAPRGSLEFQLLQSGFPKLRQFLRDAKLPRRECGALVVARSPTEAALLDHVVLENYSAGLAASRLDRAAAFRLEPNLSPDVHAAVLVPDEIVVDSWLVGAAYLHDACRVGDVTVHRDCAVTGAKPVAGGWLLETTQGEVRCAVAVNCAGNHADNVEALALGNARPGHPQRFRAVPRKGQYVVLAPPPGFHSAADLVGRPIQPLPNETTKGVFVFPSLSGHVVVGPTSIECTERSHLEPEASTTAMLLEHGAKLVPALKDATVVTAYVGLRPGSEHRDYQIWSDVMPNWVTVAGIRSTGVSASIGIAEHVVNTHILPLLPADAATIRTPSSPSPAMKWTRVGTDGSDILATLSPALTDSKLYVTHPLSRLFASKWS